MKDWFPHRLFWPLAILGLFVVRVPYLISPGRILDGDEAILGLMARHIAALEEFPLFFWGQTYGLSVVEAFPAAMAFRLFGSSPLVLSLTMFGLFSCGLWLFCVGFQNLAGSRGWARTLTLGLGLLPVWIIWSFKARGGYVGAFLVAGLILSLVTARRFGWVKGGITGAAMGALFFSQPLWCMAFLPLLLIPFTKEAGLREGVAVALGGVVVGAVLAFLSSQSNVFWVPDVLGAPAISKALRLPRGLFWMFSGFFHYEGIQTPPLPVAAVAGLGVALWTLALVGLGMAGTRSREWAPWLMVCALLGSGAGALLLNDLPPRYLLQASVLLVVAAASWIGSRGYPFSGRSSVLSAGALLALAATTTFVPAMRLASPSSNSDLETELLNLIGELEERGVKGVYSMDALLQWQILFYGQERIPARFASPVDRYPEYPMQVDSALQGGEKVALVGTRHQAQSLLRSPLAHRVESVSEEYFLLVDPPGPFLEELGFLFLPEP